MTTIIESFVERRKAEVRSGVFRKLRRPRRQLTPRGIERRYRSDLLRMVRDINQLVRDRLFPQLDGIVDAAFLRGDGERTDIEDIGLIIESIVGPIKSRISAENLRRSDALVQKYFEATSDQGRNQTLRQLKGILGVEAFPPEPQLRAMLSSFRQENRQLIDRLTDSQVDEISELVQREVRAGSRAGTIKQAIRRRFKIGEKRAALIARDQINKLNGQLTRMRQTNLGVREYIWRTSRDERVRQKHLDREGTKFRWDRPPEGGHPGQEVNCRCTAEPVIPGFTKEPTRAENRKIIREVKQKRKELRG